MIVKCGRAKAILLSRINSGLHNIENHVLNANIDH